MRRPAVAHILAANDRYNKRLGPQFAAAITYFSVLSMVPILLFAVSMLGMTLTVLRPDLLVVVKDAITSELGKTTAAASATKFIDGLFKNWAQTTWVALLTAAYSGSNWVGNLKKAFRVMWRDKFSEASQTKNFFLELLENLMIFLGVLLAVGVAVGITSGGGTFSGQVIAWLGLSEVPGIGWMLRVVSIVLTFVASWLLFAFIFLVLPGRGTDRRTWLIGVTAGATLVTALQQVAGLLISVFSNNATAGVFGTVIVVMLVLNLLATIILMVGAWVGTADTWQQEQLKRDADKAAGVTDRSEVEIDGEEKASPGVPAAAAPSAARTRADEIRATRWASSKPLDDLRASAWDPDTAQAPESEPVSARVAERSVKVGMGVGYGLGAATGVGLGAVIAAAVARLRRRP